MSAKAETGNLPDVATTATIAAQNIDQISEPTATSAVKPDAETTASNKKIDSISWSEQQKRHSQQPLNLQPTCKYYCCTQKSEAATSKLRNRNSAKYLPCCRYSKSEETAKIADNSVNVQSTSRLPKRAIDLPQLLPRAIILK